MKCPVDLHWIGWTVQGTDHSTAVGIRWYTAAHVRFVALGFGWDHEQPFRPWPTLVTRGTTGATRFWSPFTWGRTISNPVGRSRGWCLCFLGLFFHCRWRSLREVLNDA